MARLFEDEHRAGWRRLSDVGAYAPWELVTDQTTRQTLAFWFAAELWHGLTHAESVKQEFDRKLRGARAGGSEWVTHGADSTRTTFLSLPLLGPNSAARSLLNIKTPPERLTSHLNR